MRWKWGLLCGAGAACLAVAGASAANSAHVFLVTLRGTASAQWDHTAAPMVEAGCTRTERTEGIRSVHFRSSATRVRIVDGRLIAVELRGVRGKVTLGGAETTETRCADGTGSAEVRDCITSTRSLARGAVRLTSPERGRLAFGAVRGVRLALSNCPDEVAPVRGAPAGPSPRSIRLPLAKLTSPRTRSVTMRVSTRRTDAFDPPETGTITQRATWTLTFKRVGAP